MINIFEYTDYRQYLSDLFKELKETKPYFSHRYVNRKLGLKSPSFFHMVMQGKRNLGSQVCSKVSQVLNHTDQESEYFKNMVSFNQTTQAGDKNRFMRNMMSLRRDQDIILLEDEQYELFSKWYNIPVQLLVTHLEYPLDYEVLAKSLIPPITAKQARESVETLLKIGLLDETESGFVQKKPWITVDFEKITESIQLTLFSFRKELAKVNSASMSKCALEEIDFSTVTTWLSEESFQKVKEELHRCRDTIASLAGMDHSPNQKLYTINMQIFPISQKMKMISDE